MPDDQAKQGVIFFNAGTKHCVHLAVAVASLREHYHGPVALITEQEGPGRIACELIAKDQRLAPISVIADPSVRAGSHGVSYQSKTVLWKFSPFDVTLFLDADTLVVGEFSELWPEFESGEVVLTQFADWLSTGGRFPPRGKMPQRIESWRRFEPARVERMFEKHWPAINTGVMAWSKNSRAFLEEWHRVTCLRNEFIVDETAAQIIFPDFNCRVMDDRFNASVIYPRAGEDVLTREDVRILHFHGGKAWKRPQGRRLYLPHYERCLRSNFGNIRSIKPHQKFFRQLDRADQERLLSYMDMPAREGLLAAA